MLQKKELLLIFILIFFSVAGVVAQNSNALLFFQENVNNIQSNSLDNSTKRDAQDLEATQNFQEEPGLADIQTPVKDGTEPEINKNGSVNNPQFDQKQLRQRIFESLQMASSSFLGSGQLVKIENAESKEVDSTLSYMEQELLLKRELEKKAKEEEVFLDNIKVGANEESTKGSIEKKSTVKQSLPKKLSGEQKQEFINQLSLSINEPELFLNNLGYLFLVHNMQIKHKVSMKKYHYVEIEFLITVYNFTGKESSKVELDIAVAGFKAEGQLAYQEALSFVSNQLLTELSSYQVVSGRLSVIEILDRDEVVASAGINQGIYVGATFSIVKYVNSLVQENNTKGLDIKERKEKIVGQLIVYAVRDSFSYCEVVYLTDKILVGDKLLLDKRVGLSTDISFSLLASVGAATDNLDVTGYLDVSTKQQPASNIGPFSEFAGMLTIRETINYGCYLVKPFFGLDVMIDGDFVQNSNSGLSYSATQLYALGNLGGEPFKGYSSYGGWVRPFVGASMNWYLNRVTLSPNLAIGFILNNPINLYFSQATTTSLSEDDGTGISPNDGLETGAISETIFNYFTVSAGADIKVHINSRFSFNFSLGYEYWLGNHIELSDVDLGKRYPASKKKLTSNDFIKFYDFQFVKIGAGFSVHY